MKILHPCLFFYMNISNCFPHLLSQIIFPYKVNQCFHQINCIGSHILKPDFFHICHPFSKFYRWLLYLLILLLLFIQELHLECIHFFYGRWQPVNFFSVLSSIFYNYLEIFSTYLCYIIYIILYYIFYFNIPHLDMLLVQHIR